MDPTRRELLSKAFDEAEEEVRDEDTVVGSTPPADDTGGVDALAEAGKKEVAEAGAEEETTEEKPATVKTVKADPYKIEKAAADAVLKEPVVTKPTTDRAPQSWKPAAREHWDKIPAEVRAEIARVDKEIQKHLYQNAEARKFADGFQQTVAPFAHLIQAEGSTPLAAVKNLMTTAAGLRAGNAGQKAKIVAEIIQSYGVDIATLDSVLSGQAPQGGAPAQGGGVAPEVMQMLKPVYSFMQEIQQTRQEREKEVQQRAAEQIEALSTQLPFFEDMREDMADILEVAAKRGVTLTPEQAYERALQYNPEIQKVVQQRKEAEQARNGGGTRISSARRAASAVRGGPAAGALSPEKPADRRAALSAAWDEAQGG